MEVHYKSLYPKWKEIAAETFLFATYLPDQEIDVIIKHRELIGVNYLRASQRRANHLSINTIAVAEKCVRKVKEIRHFSFPRSVFCKFVPDTELVLDKTFEHDRELAKLPKFIKDPVDLEATN